MLDIIIGDLLVIEDKEYPIRGCARWASWRGGRSIVRMLAHEGYTKRQPPIVDGKRGAPAIHLPVVACTPLDPASAELTRRMALETPVGLLSTVVDGGNAFYDLVLEDIQ